MADHQIFAPTGFSIGDAAAAKVVSNAKYADGRYCELHFQRGKQVRLSIYNSHTVCNSCLEFLTEEAERKSNESAGRDMGPAATFTELALKELLEEPPGGGAA
jgi:hypothetical protein